MNKRAFAYIGAIAAAANLYRRIEFQRNLDRGKGAPASKFAEATRDMIEAIQLARTAWEMCKPSPEAIVEATEIAVRLAGEYFARCAVGPPVDVDSANRKEES